MEQTQKIRRSIIRMGVPAMVGMLVTALYNAVDTLFVAGLGTVEVAAASVVFPLLMLVAAVAFAFGTGSAAFISRLLGSGEPKRASQVASTAFILTIIFASCLALSILIFDRSLYGLFTSDAQVLDSAVIYGRSMLLGAVINSGTITVNNILRSQKLAREAMVTMLLGSVVNIILDPIFIYLFDLGIAGAGIATLIAQSAALLYALRSIGSDASQIRLQRVAVRLTDGRMVATILSVGIPVLVYQLLSSLSIAFVTQQASAYGTEAIAAFGIVTRLMTLFSYVVYGFVKGLQPVAGYAYGEGRLDKMLLSVRISSRLLTGYCIAVVLIVAVAGRAIIALYTTDPVVAALAGRVLLIWSLTFPLLGYQMSYVTAFLATEQIAYGSITGLARQGVLLLPLVLLLSRLFGLEGLILATPLADAGTFVLTLLCSRSAKRRWSAVGEPVRL